MARYDYTCAACGRRFEVVHGIHEEGPNACPLCGSGPIRKAFAAPAIHFKGSGWAKKERRATRSPGPSSSDDGSSGDAAAATTGTDAPASGAAKSATTGAKTGDAAPAAGPASGD
jgi:putative FmdB family regulatory protein